MDGLISALASINVPARKMDPTDLIGWIDDITSPTTAAGEDVVNYNPLDPIADKAVRRDVELHIEPDRVMLRTVRFRPTGARVDAEERKSAAAEQGGEARVEPGGRGRL